MHYSPYVKKHITEPRPSRPTPPRAKLVQKAIVGRTVTSIANTESILQRYGINVSDDPTALGRLETEIDLQEEFDRILRKYGEVF